VLWVGREFLLRYRYQACNKPGKSSVLYSCVRGIVTMSVTSQESHQSCICVLEVSLPWLVTDMVTIPLTHTYMTDDFPSLLQAW
jgi:hypothetical protein